jgi:hypothetical protein
VVLTHCSCSFETDSIGNKGGWMKCCEASGRLTVERVLGAICRVEVLQTYGLKNANTLLHNVTISSTGGSGRLEYDNAANEKKGFQLGGVLFRNTTEGKVRKTGKRKQSSSEPTMTTVLDIFESYLEKLGYASYIPYLRSYFAEVTQLMAKHGSMFSGGASKLLSGGSWKETLLAASNMVTDRASRLANHADKPSCLPALITCHNPVPSRPFTGGDFLLFECGFRLEYGLGDVIMMNGAREHAVLPFTNAGSGCIRHSMVHFSRDGPESDHLE